MINLLLVEADRIFGSAAERFVDHIHRQLFGHGEDGGFGTERLSQG